MAERGVSDLIGYVLIFSLVTATVGIVSVAGVSALQDARDAEQSWNAQRAFDVLADNLADIHSEGAPSRATEMSLAEASVTTSETALLTISARNITSDTIENISVIESTVLVWKSNRGPETEIVYSFGVVLRSQRESGIVTREGPFQFDTDRTIIPIVQTRTQSPQSLAGGTIRVLGTRSNPSILYSGDASQFSSLWVNITTNHGAAWEQYLDSKEDLSCSITSLGSGRSRVECKQSAVDQLYVTFHPINIVLER